MAMGKCREVRIHAGSDVDADVFLKMIFGKNLQAFAEEVRKNAAGKYDDLFEQGPKKSEKVGSGGEP